MDGVGRFGRLGCLPRVGVSAQGGEGVCPGVSAWGCLPSGCLAKGKCLPVGCLPRGCLPRGYLPRLWAEFLTHTCENITFPQLLL